MDKEHDSFDENFRPKGAIVFFLLLLLLSALVWFGIYNIQLERHS
ncbi:hypothetical protein [Rhizosphaericola mali]|nr:hypothetical protein [Rhizosphaericola mali]